MVVDNIVLVGINDGETISGVVVLEDRQRRGAKMEATLAELRLSFQDIRLSDLVLHVSAGEVTFKSFVTCDNFTHDIVFLCGAIVARPTVDNVVVDLCVIAWQGVAAPRLLVVKCHLQAPAQLAISSVRIVVPETTCHELVEKLCAYQCQHTAHAHEGIDFLTVGIKTCDLDAEVGVDFLSCVEK